MAQLFDADDLTGWLGEDVAELRAVAAERVVWGWLKPILGVAERPTVVSDELFAWAVELGGIAYRNPTGASAMRFNNIEMQGLLERRAEILEEVAGSSDASAAHQPLGDFPDAQDYPDPARPCRSLW